MSLLKNLMGGLRGLFQTKKVAAEVDEELRLYLEHATDKKIQSGMSHAEALRAARAEMGSLDAVKEQVHQAGWESAVQEFGRDLRFGARMLRQTPSVTLAAVVTLALGIGVNTGIFTILNAAALQLLPVPHADELVMVSQNFDKSRGPIHRNVRNNASLFSYPEYLEYRGQNQVFTGLLAYTPFVKATLSGEPPQQLLGTLVSCNYFKVLEVRPQIGQDFSEADCAPANATPEVILSDDLWRGAFGADAAIIGKTIHLNRASFVVVGVAPSGFQGTEPVQSQFWAPLTTQNTLMRDRDRLSDAYQSWLGLIGRTKPNVEPEQVKADLVLIASRIDQLQPGRVTTIELEKATLFAVPEERSTLLGAGGVLLLAVGLVLLIACANVANLLLSRAFARRKEIAVRRALGASRLRLVRQLLTESLLLAFLGGAVGSIIATWLSPPLLRFLLSHLPQGLPPLALMATPDLRVLAFTIVLTLVTGIAFGLVPALHATRTDLTLAMKEEGSETQAGSGRGGWLRSALVVVQIAVCMVLLLTAGLLLRGLQRTQTMDLGFSMKDIALVSFDLTAAGYTEASSKAFQQQLREHVLAIPGVDVVAQASLSPLGDDHWITNFSLPGKSGVYNIEYNNVSPEYFPLLRIPIVRGRNFTAAEARTGAPVVILNESTARLLWLADDPIGKILHDGSGPGAAGLQVVGIVKNALVANLAQPEKFYLFRPAGPKEQIKMQLMVHSGTDYAATAKAIASAARALDPELAVNVTRLDDNMEIWRSRSRVVTVFSSVLGALGLFLASIGVYGMVSYAVSRRVREIGVRMALGANENNIMLLIVRQGMLPVVVGAGIGAACCAAVSSLMASLLYGVSPWDPVSFLFVPAFLIAVAVAACWLPARRAAHVDPIESLRCG